MVISQAEASARLKKKDPAAFELKLVAAAELLPVILTLIIFAPMLWSWFYSPTYE